MNRFRSYGRLDDEPEIIGDALFARLDMRSDPATLPPGTVRRSENMRFDSQGAQVRAGLARQLAPGDTIQPILFAAVYRPDNDHDRIAHITPTRLVLFDPENQTVASYDFPAGETIVEGEPVDFVQGGVSSGTTPDAYILRGFAKTTLKFNGSTVAVAAQFEQGEFALFYQDRMAVNTTRQELSVSDFLDFTTWSVLNQFQILKGSDDYVVGCLAYQKDFVIVGTRKRFFLAYFAPQYDGGGYAGGLSGLNSFLRSLTREAGPVGRRAMIEVGGRIWFLTDNGIYAFVPQLDLELTTLGEPLSAPIQPIMDRLSAEYASGAVIEHFGHRLYFAVPISDEPLAIVSGVVRSASPALPDSAVYDGSGIVEYHELVIGVAYTWTPGDANGIISCGVDSFDNSAIYPGSITFTLQETSAAVSGGTPGTTFTGVLAPAEPIPLQLPFDLPASLTGGSYLVDFETETDHNLAEGEQIQITGSIDPTLNGPKTVSAVTDSTHFTADVEDIAGGDVGERATVQRVATRNNKILVFNLALQAWESVDSLPAGVYADFLRVADYGTRRRLWLVDADLGPCLYEQGDTDEIGDEIGGLALDFDLPAELSVGNFESAPIAGRLTSRTLRWGAFARHVRAGETRLTAGPDDAGTVTLTVQTPDSDDWTSTRSFDGTDRADIAVRQRSGARGLEAELDVITTSGRPTVRALEIEMTASGRVKEE